MKLIEIIKILEAEFPPEGAYEWDNVGLLVGDNTAEISKILVTLDITEKTIAEAVDNGCQLILSHHPIMFSGIKRITSASSEGRILLSAIKNGLNIYAAHTNCDVAPKGINAYLADMLGIENPSPLEDNGLGRIGTLKEECTLSKLCEKVKSTLGIDFVRYCGDESNIIKTVALGSGACADSIPFAIEKGADVMITGDTKYHNMLDVCSDISVIDAGHYGTEIVVCHIFTELFKNLPVEVISTKSFDVYKVI